MDTPELIVVDVHRAGRWCQVVLMEGTQATFLDRDTSPYVGVVSADLGPHAEDVLAELRPGLQEIVCFDSLAEPVVAGQDFAMRTLEEWGFGQDFVFTVPELEDAVDYAVDQVLQPEHGGWEGRFVVVVGPTNVVDRAHGHLVRD